MDNPAGTRRAVDARAPRWCAGVINAFASRGAIGRVMLLALALTIPSLWSGLIADDHYHAARFKTPDFLPEFANFSRLDLFSISDGRRETNRQLISQGVLPWWADSEFRFQMWRPLAEFSHWLDYRLWPDSPWLMHAHQILWVMALLGVVLLFYRQVLHTQAAYPLAFALFALSGNLSQAVTWLAARNTLMAATFGIAALLLHIRAQSEGRLPLQLLAWCLFALALLTSEFGLGTSTWLFAWAMTVPGARFWKRISQLLPYGFIMLAWAWVYLRGQYGVAESDFYIDPATAPQDYLTFLVQRAPDAIFTAIFGISSALLGGGGIADPGWLIAIAVCAFFLWMSRHAVQQHPWRFLLTGALLSILPIAAGPGGARTLIFVSLGLAPFVADLLLRWVQGNAQPGRHARQLSWLAWPLIICLLFGIIVRPATALAMRYYDRKHVTGPAQHLPLTETRHPQQVVLLNPNSVLHAILYPVVRAQLGMPQSDRLYALTSSKRSVRIVRDGVNSLQITPEDGFMSEAAAYFVRPKDEAFTQGQTFNLPGMTARILTLGADQRPATVRFTFTEPLESTRLKFLRCEQMQYALFDIPAVGEIVELAPCDQR